jgi:heat shock protein HtpX
MNFFQIGKRLMLFFLVNLLVIMTVGILFALLSAGHFVPQSYFGYLMVWSAVLGFGGALVSLLMSRLAAKWFMGVEVVSPDTSEPRLRELVETVRELTRQAGLPMPEVGVYQSPDVNAFATGPSRSRALVAVSSGLLNSLNLRQTKAVLGHEVTHIANGDMVTMTLIQGVVNAFALFLSEVLAFVVSQALRSRNDRGGNYFVRWILAGLFRVVFMLLGMIVVCWFSRWREYRADAGGARLAGRENMIDALRALGRFYSPEIVAAEARRSQAFQALKISGPSMALLFADHPPLEERIRRLEKGIY